MDFLGQMRELDSLVPVTTCDPQTGEDVEFHAVTRYADVVAMSKRPGDFCSGRGTHIFDASPEAQEFFGSFMVMDDPRHARQRRIVGRTFSPTSLSNLLDSVQRICDEIIDQFCKEGEVDLVKVLSEPFPLLVICDMMGIPRSEFATVLRATNMILGMGDPDTIGEGQDPVTAGITAAMDLAALMGELAEVRRADPKDDLTSALVHNQLDDEVLTPAELVAFFILLTVAGNDTTRNAISHGVQLLSANPRQREIWRGDIEGVTRTAVDEIVRYATPVTFMRRTVTHELEFAGHALREGDRLVMFYGVANRDPLAFSEPDAFDVTRDPNNHLSFGGPGPHFCLGAHLARREIGVAFRQLFRRLPDLEMTGPAVPLQPTGIPIVSGIKSLPVRFTPTAPIGS